MRPSRPPDELHDAGSDRRCSPRKRPQRARPVVGIAAQIDRPSSPPTEDARIPFERVSARPKLIVDVTERSRPPRLLHRPLSMDGALDRQRIRRACRPFISAPRMCIGTVSRPPFVRSKTSKVGGVGCPRRRTIAIDPERNTATTARPAGSPVEHAQQVRLLKQPIVDRARRGTRCR